MMKKRRSRWEWQLRLPWGMALVAASLLPRAAIADIWIPPRIEIKPVPDSTPAPPLTPNAPRMVQELPTEVKRMIDAARRLHEEPGLLLDRRAIYSVLDARFINKKISVSTEGTKSMGEGFEPEQSLQVKDWQGSLYYVEHEQLASWTLVVKLDYRGYRDCFHSRLVEAYWGQPFAFRPLGVHGPFEAGPHDGYPYRQEFVSKFSDGANITFGIANGGCLTSISMSNIFKFKEFSNDRIYN
ncbi:hypothetical protein VARIO8X_50595 [Burkholderiales bacterium 8X]|nr:hypothetical protein VARIO8X_50595 [Burkholderiales bacterium 8X]